MKLLLLIICSINVFAQEFTPVSSLNNVTALKSEIVKIARFYKGQGDEDFKIQNTLQPYVDKLLVLSPQPVIANRIDILAGAWKQVWGPYNYRNEKRIVDPQLDPDNIFQVVSANGYYYNVSNQFKKKSKETKSTSILRGIYDIQPGYGLKVSFTKLTRIKGKPSHGLRYIDIPALSENGILENEKKVLPNWFVRRTFSGGILVEVYTDEDLRITYGTNSNEFSKPYLYIMTRVE
jgi:hypothetical protein